ncbi:MAG: hypothetical protein GTO00_10650 [Deltaproteobacteria bacterium]|nr:hypothetical protein [Deltaproteobacteria bacterium]
MGKDNRKNRVPIVGEWKPVSFMIRKESGEEVYPFGEKPLVESRNISSISK